VSYLNLNESAQMVKFYQGLKSKIKDKILYINSCPETLNEMIEQATKIDNYLYKQKLENQ